MRRRLVWVEVEAGDSAGMALNGGHLWSGDERQSPTAQRSTAKKNTNTKGHVANQKARHGHSHSVQERVQKLSIDCSEKRPKSITTLCEREDRSAEQTKDLQLRSCVVGRNPREKQCQHLSPTNQVEASWAKKSPKTKI